MKRLALVLAFFWVLFGSCTNNPQKNDGASATSATSTTPTTIPSNITASVDWKARTVSITGIDTYAIEFCEGAGPLLCVSKAGEVLGVIELVSRSDDSFNADGFLDDMEADRKQGCPGYVMTRDADVTDKYYAWTGRMNGKVVERVVGVVVESASDLHILVMNALADSGCLNRESELPLAVAAEIEPVIAALAAGSTGLPAV